MQMLTLCDQGSYTAFQLLLAGLCGQDRRNPETLLLLLLLLAMLLLPLLLLRLLCPAWTWPSSRASALGCWGQMGQVTTIYI
jgi:hypothetical protein